MQWLDRPAKKATKPGSTLLESLIDFRPDPGVPFPVEVALPRLVPIQTSAISEEGGPLELTQAEPDACKFWWVAPDPANRPGLKSHSSGALVVSPTAALPSMTHFIEVQGLNTARELAAARPDRQLAVVVRSGSGPMEGKVSIRANPVGKPAEGDPPPPQAMARREVANQRER